jgi:hypothetical protein
MATTTRVNEHTHSYTKSSVNTGETNGHTHSVIKDRDGEVVGFGITNGHSHGV